MLHLLNAGLPEAGLAEAWTYAPPMEETDNPLIQRLKGFATLTAADRALLVHQCANARSYPPETDLVRESEALDGILVVLEGFACWHQYRPTGARQISAFLLPGDLCEWDNALIGHSDHAVSTLSACRIARMPRQLVYESLGAQSGLAMAMRMNGLVYEAVLREWMMNVGCRPAMERIGHLFCELHARLDSVGLTDGMSFDLPLTQSDLAATVGLSNVHVNRSLQALRRERLITLKGRRLTILDWAGLTKLAEFNPSYLRLWRPEAV